MTLPLHGYLKPVFMVENCKSQVYRNKKRLTISGLQSKKQILTASIAAINSLNLPCLVESNGASLVAQGIDRVELGGSDGGIDSKEHPDTYGESETEPSGPERHIGGKLVFHRKPNQRGDAVAKGHA